MLLLRSLLGLVRLRQSSQPSRHSCTPSSIKLTPGQRAMWLGERSFLPVRTVGLFA
jgi:hypothetical protein